MCVALAVPLRHLRGSEEGHGQFYAVHAVPTVTGRPLPRSSADDLLEVQQAVASQSLIPSGFRYAW
jgi:hypothetical protein